MSQSTYTQYNKIPYNSVCHCVIETVCVVNILDLLWLNGRCHSIFVCLYIVWTFSLFKIFFVVFFHIYIHICNAFISNDMSIRSNKITLDSIKWCLNLIWFDSFRSLLLLLLVYALFFHSTGLSPSIKHKTPTWFREIK